MGKEAEEDQKRWLDGIKEDYESLSMTIQEATRTAQDRTIGRRILKELPLRNSPASPRTQTRKMRKL